MSPRRPLPPPARPARSPALARLATTIRVAPSLLRAPVVVASPHEVHTERLCLRPLAESDRDAYTALVRTSRAHLARHFPLHRPGESDEALFERHLAFSRAALATGRAWRRVVCLDGVGIIGAVNLNDITEGDDRSGEMNFWIGPRYTRLGLCSEAMRATLDRALGRSPRGLGLARVWGYVAPENAACLRLIERLGFTLDERALPVQLNLAERWVTHHTYAKRAPAPALALQRIVAGALRPRPA